MTYDSRARMVCLEVAKLIALGEYDLEMAERGTEIDCRTDKMGERASVAIEDASKRNKAWRWAKMGAGAAVGGTVIGK
jgi:hypothetical protein